MGLRAHTGRVALTYIAAAAALAVAAPLANAARGHKAACNQAPAGWITVTDDQGVPWLVRSGQMLSACTQTKTAPATPEAVCNQAPAGWVSVTDDLGIPWLVPAGLALSAERESCSQAQTAPVAPVTTTTQASPAPYPGYVLVFDDQGVAHFEQGT
jgi:hypothetical protein